MTDEQQTNTAALKQPTTEGCLKTVVRDPNTNSPEQENYAVARAHLDSAVENRKTGAWFAGFLLTAAFAGIFAADKPQFAIPWAVIFVLAALVLLSVTWCKNPIGPLTYTLVWAEADLEKANSEQNAETHVTASVSVDLLLEERYRLVGIRKWSSQA